MRLRILAMLGGMLHGFEMQSKLEVLMPLINKMQLSSCQGRAGSCDLCSASTYAMIRITVEQKLELRSAQEIADLGRQGSYLPSRPLAPEQVAVFEDARRGKWSHLVYLPIRSTS
jgi:hypothetical protein